MNDRKGSRLFLIALIALGSGGLIPLVIFDLNLHSTAIQISFVVSGIAATFFTVFFFLRLGKKHLALRQWATDSLYGISFMLFSGGFITMLLSSLYMEIPIPQWLHLSGSVVLGVIASGFMFNEFMGNN